jgi:hypothetical protein
LTRWGYDRKVCIQNSSNGYKKRVEVICENEVIKGPEIVKCKSFEEMLKEASIHRLSKKMGENIEKPLMYNNIRGFQKKTPRFLDSCESLLNLIINRTDVHALQQPDGRYFKAPIGISDEAIRKHLDGILTIGVYQFSPDNKVKWVCFDVDSHAQKNITETPLAIQKRNEKAEVDVLRLCNYLKSVGVPFLLEKSGSPHSYHIWVFVEPVEGKKAKFFGDMIKKESGIDCEVFPKQARVDAGGYGNLVKLPLATHQLHKTKSQIQVNGEFVGDFSRLEIGILDISAIEVPDHKSPIPKPGMDDITIHGKSCPKTDIRPCIVAALNNQLVSDPGNFMRVSIVREHYNSGISDPKKLASLFQNQRDYSEEKSLYHVRRILSKKVSRIKCETLREKGQHYVDCSGCPYGHSFFNVQCVSRFATSVI